METPYNQEIVDKGAAAYKAGVPNGMNPYRATLSPDDTLKSALRRKQFASWQYGWRCAMAEAEATAIRELSDPMQGAPH